MRNSQLQQSKRFTYSLDEVAEGFGISRSQVCKLIKEKKLKSLKLGDRRVVPAEVIDALLAEAA